VSYVKYTGGKRPLRVYIAVCLQIHLNHVAWWCSMYVFGSDD